MKHKTQSGFAYFALVAIIVILAAVGGVGYYVYHKNHESKKNDSSNSQTQSDDKTTAKVTTYEECTKATGSKIQETFPQVCITKAGQTFTQPNTQKYLVIKEWGVKIPLTSNISDAYYTYDSKIDAVYLSKTRYKGTDCAADSITLGVLDRYSVNAVKPQVSGVNAIKIGDYYYFYQHPQAACDGQVGNSTADFDSAKATVAGQYMLDFKAAVDNLVVE